MTNSSLPPDFDELLRDLSDGTITPQNHSRLEQILSQSEQARSRYLTFIDNQIGLERLFQHQQANPGFNLLTRPIPAKSGPSRRSWKFVTSAAVLMGAIAVFVFVTLPQQGGHQQENQLTGTGPHSEQTQLSSPPSGAKVAQAAGAELFGMLLPSIGTSLQQHEEYTLVRGAMELTFPSGATALIDAPAVFIVENDSRLKLKTGNCSVHAPEGAEGFEVVTPHSRVVDIGTRFLVNVDEVGASAVHVVEGAAEIYSATNPAERKLLKQGEARLTTEDDRLNLIPFNDSLYRHALPDRVISYEASPDPSFPAYIRDLTTVTVQRAGVPHTYQVDELIGVDVIDFVGEGDSACLAWFGDFPDDPLDALRDRALNTGICNFGTIAASRLSNEKRRGEFPSQAGPPRMKIRFHQPVINGAGPDIVLFEVQPAIHDPRGDAFYAEPLINFDGARKHHIPQFDITMNSRNALRIHSLRMAEYQRPPQSVEEFKTIDYFWKPLSFPFYVLAVGIDLSDLGYEIGERCEGLLFHDGNDDRNFVDPVLIGGLPDRPLPPIASSPSQ